MLWIIVDWIIIFIINLHYIFIYYIILYLLLIFCIISSIFLIDSVTIHTTDQNWREISNEKVRKLTLTLYFLTLKNRMSKLNFFQNFERTNFVLPVYSFPFHIQIWNYINEFVNLSFNIKKTQKVSLSLELFAALYIVKLKVATTLSTFPLITLLISYIVSSFSEN